MFNNLKVGTKLAVGFFGIVVCVLGISALIGLKSMNSQAKDLAENWLPSVNIVRVVDTKTSDYRVFEYRHILSDTSEQMDDVEKRMKDQLSSIDKNRKEYEGLISSPEQQKIYDEFGRQYQEYLNISKKVQLLSRQMKNQEAMAVMVGESKKIFDSSSELLQQLVELNVKGGQQSAIQAQNVYETNQSMTVSFLLIVVTFSVAIAFVLTRSITRPLRQAVLTANSLADGDLTIDVQVDSKDETGQLQQAVSFFSLNGELAKSKGTTSNRVEQHRLAKPASKAIPLRTPSVAENQFTRF